VNALERRRVSNPGYAKRRVVLAELHQVASKLTLKLGGYRYQLKLADAALNTPYTFTLFIHKDTSEEAHIHLGWTKREALTKLNAMMEVFEILEWVASIKEDSED
jgi:hypothetical protein